MPKSKARRKTTGQSATKLLTLEDLAAYCGDECSPEVRRQIQAEAADPGSDLGQFFAALRGYDGWACSPDMFADGGTAAGG